MFRVHSIILDLMELDPKKIPDHKFKAFKILSEERHLMVTEAKDKRSFAY